MGYWQEYHRDKRHFSSFHVKEYISTYNLSLVILTLIICLKCCLPGFSAIKLLFFPSPHSIFWKRVTKSSPHPRGGKLSPTPWRRRVHIHNLVFSLRKVCAFSSFIYFFNCFFISLWTQIVILFLRL